MPLRPTDLKRVFVVAQPTETLATIAARQPDDLQQAYVLIAAPGGYHVLWLEDIVTLGLPPDTLLGDLPNLPAASAAVENDTLTLQRANSLRNGQPNRRLVVLEQGAVIGIYSSETRSVQIPRQMPDSIPMPIPQAPAMPMPMPRPSDGISSGAEPSATLGEESAPPPRPSARTDDRVINAWIGDHPPDVPLQADTTYDLNFNIASPRAGAATVAFDATQVFSPRQRKADVLVVLTSEDVEIIGEYQGTLVVPRNGPSQNTLHFTIRPLRNGPARITAVFFAAGRVFQKMTITFQVGPLVQVEATGGTIGSALAASERAESTPATQRRTVSLTILKQANGYLFLLRNGGLRRFTLNLGDAAVEAMIARARQELLMIVKTKASDGGLPIYQRPDTTIPADVHEGTLRRLAELGNLLFEKLFFSPGSNGQELGMLLRDYSRQHRLHIEIVAERFIFPWALLYDQTYDDGDAVDASAFWGFRHIIEYTPEFSASTPINIDPVIAVPQTLDLAFVCNTNIDTELASLNERFDLASRNQALPPVVARQRAFLPTLEGVSVREYPTVADLIGLLNGTSSAQLLYFYCHAISRLPNEPGGGVDGSKFVLSDGEVTLEKLLTRAGTSRGTMPQAPLVFLNACESAELSPLLYDGLVPYLINKGARGVLGTEVETPAAFAAEFASLFLPRFVSGAVTLGELLLELRQRYLTEKNNVLGLLYALYSSSEVQVVRG